MRPLYADSGPRTSPLEEIRRSIELLYLAGEVAELRAFGKRKTYAGWFDDHDKLAEHIAELDAKGFDCYVTMNPCHCALLGRVDNEVIEVDPKRSPLTSDTDVERRRWVLIDFDPKRPSKVSATDEEVSAALSRAAEVKTYLENRGCDGIALATSGNGVHMLVPVDLPNDQDSRALIEGFLKALSFKFSDDDVEVDESTFNAARITKPYGVMARKGSDVPRIGRVHRRSKLVEVPQGTGPVSREPLCSIAEEKPEEQQRRFRDKPQEDGYGEFDLADWIARHGLRVKREGPWSDGGYRWVLEECLRGHADSSAYIVRGRDGWIAYGCHHNSCQGDRWQDLREHYEPGAYERNGHQAEPNEAAPGVDQWEPPAPLPDVLPPVDAFDPVMLPECLKGWLEDIAERMQVPLDYLAAGAMVVIGSLVGRKLGIYPKKRDDWIVVPNLWGMIVGRSALLKSPALAEVMKPLGRLIADAHEAHEEELAEYEIKAMVAEAEAKALKKNIEQLAS